MPKSRPPYPPEFRRKIIALYRAGRSIGSLAREFEPSADTISNWVKQADLDEGAREDGPTSAERAELRRIRRENARLREEQEILSKAAAWFARVRRDPPMMRRASAILLVIAVSLVTGAVEAEESRTRAERIADFARQAFEAGEKEKLGLFVRNRPTDIWPVAAALCDDGAYDTVDELVRAAHGKDNERLAAYVVWRKSNPLPAAIRHALRVAEAALGREEPAATLEALDGVEGGDDRLAEYEIQVLRAQAWRDLRRRTEAGEAFLAASQTAEEPGYWLGAAAMAFFAARLAMDHGDFRTALTRFARQLRLEEVRGDRAEAAMVLGNMAIVHTELGDLEKGIELNRQALETFRDLERPHLIGTTLERLGLILMDQRAFDRAREHLEQALAIQEEHGDTAAVVQVLQNLGTLYFRMGNGQRSLELLDAAVAHGGDSLDARDRAALDVARANALHSLGESDRALELSEGALPILETHGRAHDVAGALEVMGLVTRERGETAKGRAILDRVVSLERRLGRRRQLATALRNLAAIQLDLGELDAAEASLDESMALATEQDMRALRGRILEGYGVLWHRRGHFARSLDYAGRALEDGDARGDAQLVASSLSGLGFLHQQLGHDERARALHERARAFYAARGDRANVAAQIEHLGVLSFNEGEFEVARSSFEEALRTFRALGRPASAANVLNNLGNALAELGRHDEALRALEESEQAKRRVGDEAGAAWARCCIATLHSDRGDAERAVAAATDSLAKARASGAAKAELRSLSLLARNRFRLGHWQQTMDAADEVIRRLPRLASGLSERHGAEVRRRYSSAFHFGFAAAATVGDAEGALAFAESGRAGAFLEALQVRDALGVVSLPPVLERAEGDARARVADATRALRVALAGHRRKDAGAALRVLEQARDELAMVAERIQRQAKSAAHVRYPKAASLAEMQAALRPGEALVVYVLLFGDALALVVTPDDLRQVMLGPTDDLTAACDEVRTAASRPPGPDAPGDAVERLRARVADPLELPSSVTRLLVAPHRALTTAPLAPVFPECEVVVVPSATAWLVLRERSEPRGVGVLALGDPWYRIEPGTSERTGVRGGFRLTPLPATRAEVQAVGTHVLLARDATEAGLRRALRTQPRWRAVHLACHGLVDLERPLFSSLAVTPSKTDDGFLTALDVMRLHVPADLVVLSACETGRGRFVGGEGLLGLPRAFFYAGASRVLVSLWRVDDEATRALMTRFYELWNRSGGTGLGAAAALKQAQAHVRSHDKWRHPYYWAAWVLWGLPEG